MHRDVVEGLESAKVTIARLCDRLEEARKGIDATRNAAPKEKRLGGQALTYAGCIHAIETGAAPTEFFTHAGWPQELSVDGNGFLAWSDGTRVIVLGRFTPLRAEWNDRQWCFTQPLSVW